MSYNNNLPLFYYIIYIDVTSSDDEEPENGLSEFQVSQIQKVRAAHAEQGSSCSVCLEDFHAHPDNEVMLLECDHYFHSTCLLPWLETRSSCPLCRLDLGDFYPTEEEQDFENFLNDPNEAYSDLQPGPMETDNVCGFHSQDYSNNFIATQSEQDFGSILSDSPTFSDPEPTPMESDPLVTCYCQDNSETDQDESTELSFIHDEDEQMEQCDEGTQSMNESDEETNLMVPVVVLDRIDFEVLADYISFYSPPSANTRAATARRAETFRRLMNMNNEPNAPE